MANNKDFIIKNGVEVGKDIKTTVGTITSGSVDLLTGSYFFETLSSDTTYSFTNPGGIQAFQLEVTGGSGTTGYTISTASYDSVQLATSSQDDSANAFFFKPDGTSVYVVGDQGNEINQWNLSTAWDLSTASHASTLSVSAQGTSPIGVFVGDSGTKLYHFNGSTLFQYGLTTAYDISTASYSSISFSTSSQSSSPTQLKFNSDGTTMYVAAAGSQDSIYQYTLSTAWDVSSASYASKTLSLASEEGTPRGLDFNSDFSKVWITGTITNTVYQYSMTTAGDISTASYDNVSFDAATNSGDGGGNDLQFKSDGTKLFILNGGDDILQFSSVADATVTWPSSIEWSGGETPTTPAVGEKDIYTFFTEDGGTTYLGVKSGDSFS